MSVKPTLYTSLSPSLLHLYDLSNTIVVIIDVFRATSTIASALYNGAEKIVPTDSVKGAIEIGIELGAITAGERDGKVADGLQHGNSPNEYTKEFIDGKVLVLTTTNGTRQLHMALKNGASEVITGSFPNLSAVCDYILRSGKNVLLACSAWKDRVNMEDTLFAGAVVDRVKDFFDIQCDSSYFAANLYRTNKDDIWGLLKDATHYKRLSNYGLRNDMEFCMTPDVANVLPVYMDGALRAL